MLSITKPFSTNIRNRQAIRQKTKCNLHNFPKIEVISEAITSFVMFYSTINWFVYRDYRIKVDKVIDKKKQDKQDKINKKKLDEHNIDM